MKYTLDFEYWVRCHLHKKVEPSEILAIQLKEEKPKFDPKTLQPFDKVLVRDDNTSIWRCNLFSHIENDKTYIYFCLSNNWLCCIPFNDKTKHLVGTTNEAPEFYRI